MQYEQFPQSKFKQKDKLRHTFRINNQNANYDYIPIFQKYETIKFNDKFYKIIKLQRRAETYLQYKIQHSDSYSQFTMEYQFIFDNQQNDQNYEYYQDQTRISSYESKVYRQICRIALKKNNQDQNNSLKLKRFIHLNNLNQNAKIKLLHAFANDHQLEQLDYNQIYIDDEWQIKLNKIQNQVCCFVQAPSSISPNINYQQTFLIGFYYPILNNQVLFNQYMNRKNSLKQSLQNGFKDSNFQLLQQIKGSISYQIKTQIPKNILLQEIKRIYDQNLIIECFFLLISLLNFIINQQLKEIDSLLNVYSISNRLNSSDSELDAKNNTSELTIEKSFDYEKLSIQEQLNEIIQNNQNHLQHSGLTGCFNISYEVKTSKNLNKFSQKLSHQDKVCSLEYQDQFNQLLYCLKPINVNVNETQERISNHLQNSKFSSNSNKMTCSQQEINSKLCKAVSYNMIVAFLKLISCDCDSDSDSDTILKLHVPSAQKMNKSSEFVLQIYFIKNMQLLFKESII